MRQKILLIILLALFLQGSACSLPATQSPPLATQQPLTSTLDVNALSTQVVATVYAAALTASAPPTTVTVSVPTITITPSYVKPELRFDDDTNCRGGPGIRFTLVRIFKAGEIAEPIGLPLQGNYWLVKSPSGSDICWVVGDFATPSGSVTQLPKMTIPPTYTALPVPIAPRLKSWDYSCAYANNACTVTVILVWEDLTDNESGYNIYRNSELIASLAPNANTFTDVTYLGYDQAVTYYVEVYNADGLRARTQDIKVTNK
jgi:hypothetical protein